MSKIDPALGQKFAKFADVTGQFIEQAISRIEINETQMQKLASASTGLVERCIELNLIPKTQKVAAVKAFADPAELPKLFDNLLTKLAEAASEHGKLVSMNLGAGEGAEKRASAHIAGESPFVGVRGLKSAADEKFYEDMVGSR